MSMKLLIIMKISRKILLSYYILMKTGVLQEEQFTNHNLVLKTMVN